MKDGYMLFGYDRKRTSTLTLDSQPGAHTGASRQYIPGYADSNIVFLDLVSGNDSNDGSTELLAKLTYASAATAAGSTKKIRVINNGAALSTNITKPTEMKRGVSGTISSSLTDPINSLTAAATPAWTSGKPERVTWAPKLKKYYGIGSTEIVSSADGDTWALEETLSGVTGRRIWWDQFSQRIFAGCSSGGLLYSYDGSTYTKVTVGSGTVNAFAYSESDEVYVLGEGLNIWVSPDGESWEKVYTADSDVGFTAGIYAAGKFVFGNSNGELFTSTNGYTWTMTSPFNSYEIRDFVYMENVSLYIAADNQGEIYSSPDAATWTSRRTATATDAYSFTYIRETGYAVLSESGRILTRSNNGTSWTSTGALAAYGASDQIRGIAYSPLLGRIATVGGDDGATTRVNARGPAYANTISAAVAGFTIQAVQYSGTVTAYNCTLRQPGTTAALSLDNCRVNYDSHISNNAATSRAALYIGDRHTTCAPASQNAIDCNLDTVGGTWYIYNASATAYERIRDCLVEGGIVASYNVTVSGRANVRGTSANVLFGATVTFRDPKFVDTIDYKLQFQSNGYARNSLAAGRSALYFNSAGDARDIGAWSYIESAVSHYFAKNVYIPKGQITHSVEEVVSEQQGDSGAVSVYGNVNRIKEVITIKYNTQQEAELPIIRAMRTLTDKTVLIQLDPEWSANAGSLEYHARVR
jgi:hypothetical protein